MATNRSTSSNKNPLRSTLAAIVHPSVLGALVHEDSEEKHAVLELWFRPSTTRVEQAQGRQAALIAVLNSLGTEWSACITEGDPMALASGHARDERSLEAQVA